MGVAVILSAMVFYLSSLKSQPLPLLSPTPRPTSSVPSSTVIHALVDIFGNETNFTRLTSPFVNTSTKVAISFKKVDTGTRNLAADIYVDQVKVNGKYDEVGGQGESLFSFSPDNKYFAFRTRWQSGCCASDFGIYVIDLTAKKIIEINPPQREQDYSGQKESPTQSIFPLIESYGWDNGALKITFYFVGFSSDEKYYRISPKEIWRYDLTTKQYTLLETLPENSTSSTP